MIAIHPAFGKKGEPEYHVAQDGKVVKLAGTKLKTFLAKLKSGDRVLITPHALGLSDILIQLMKRGVTIMTCHWHNSGLAKGLKEGQIALEYSKIPEDKLREFHATGEILHLRDRELAEAYVNVDFELDFDLKDRAGQLADTFLGKVMVGASGRDIIYKTLREGAVLSKEWELMRGAQEIRGAIWFGPDAERGEKPIHSEAPIPTESGKYEAWGTQGQGGGPDPDETFLTLGDALAFVRAHEDEPEEVTVCCICGAPASGCCVKCGYVRPMKYVCYRVECMNKHLEICGERQAW